MKKNENSKNLKPLILLGLLALPFIIYLGLEYQINPIAFGAFLLYLLATGAILIHA